MGEGVDLFCPLSTCDRCLEGLGRREEALSCIEGVLRLQPRIMGDAELLAEAGLLRESWDWSKHDVSF